jgi:hypothetical protein
MAWLCSEVEELVDSETEEETEMSYDEHYNKRMKHKPSCKGFNVSGLICKKCQVHTMYAGIQRYSGFCKVVLTDNCTYFGESYKNYNWWCGCLCEMPACTFSYVHKRSDVKEQ